MPKNVRENLQSSSRLSAFSLVVLSCFFCSGLAGLIYQVLWLRMIDKVVGSAPFAVSIVLSVFMGGLALGSWLAAKTIDRIATKGNLLSLYGKVEVAIGIYGMLLPFLIHLIKPVYVLAYNSLLTHFWLYQLFTFFGCCFLLIVPTTLMGVTLPVLCRFYVEDLGHIGARTGRLYGINTVGGAAGAMLCGFFLIAGFGVWGTLLTAAGINLLIGFLCIGAAGRVMSPVSGPVDGGRAKRKPPIRKDRQHRGTVPLSDGRIVVAALLIFGISGFCAMAYEVFWTRLLGLILGPTTYSFSLIVSTFIVGLALGNILFGWLGDRVREPFRLLVVTQACAAVLALLVSQFLGVSQFFFSKLLYTLQGDFGETIFAQSIVLFLVLIGPTIFLGATFPLVNKIYARSLPDIGKSVGTAYAVNTAGAILGSFIAGFVLIPLLGKENGLRITTGLQLSVPLLAMAWLMFKARERIRAFTTGLVTLCLGAGLLAMFPSWNHHILSRGWYHRFETFHKYLDTTSWFDAVWNGASIFAGHVAGYDLVFYGDGIGGFTTVERWSDTSGRTNYTLSNNGKEDASSHGDRLTQALSSHIPLLFHPDPEKVMVLGLASGMTSGEVLLYPVEQLDVLEISDQVVKAAELFEPWNNHCLTDSRARVIVQDGRNHLELTSEKYDVIISEPSNPWMAGMANLFTLEHFETVKRRLTDDGIFVQWIHSYAMDWPTFAIVGRTFSEVFPDGILMRTMQSDFLLVGFSGGKNLDMEAAEKNIVYARRSGNLTIRNPGVIFNLIVTEDLKRLFGDGPLHTDNRPRLEFAAPKNLGKSDPDIEKRIQEASRLSDQTKKMVASNGNIDASLDILELMTADSSPPFGNVDLDRATESQKTRYRDILTDYCSGEVVRDYEMFPDDDFKLQCAALQLGGIWEYLASGNEDSNAYYRLALALKITDDTGGAIDALQKSIALDPDDYNARMELGFILGTEGRTDDAAAQYAEALRISPDSPEAYHNLGVAFFQLGKPSAAIYNYYQALKFAPDSAEAHNSLGIVLADQGRTDDAVNHFTRALQIDPDYVEAYLNLANVLKKRGSTGDAIDRYLEVLQITPDDPNAHYNLGYLFAEQGRFEEALTHFSEVLKVDPKNADVEIGIGTILSRQGRVREAITHFEAALGINQNHFPAHYYLGIELLKQGQNEEAVGHLIQAAELNPENPEIYKDLGVAMGMMGRFEEAAGYFTKAIELEPDSAETHDNLGVTMAQMGRLNEAIGHFSKALEIDSSLEAARSHLATALKQAGMGR